MNVEFIKALNDLEKEKHISKEEIIEAIETALVLAYKKNYGSYQNVRVVVDNDTGDVAVLMRKDVVEEASDEMIEVSLEDALSLDSRYQIGDVIEYQVEPKAFGRIAAQTAKQVVVQKIREAERGNAYEDFVNRQGEIVTARVERISNDTVFLTIGDTDGILSISEQVQGEDFRLNEDIKVYVMDVKRTTRGPQIFLSRSHPGLVKKLFELEVPEIADGTVEIKGIAREAGSRTKLAVMSHDENVDPIGACVGSRGSRVQNIVDELFGEKIDIIVWDDVPEMLISNVLSPAKVEEVYIAIDERAAIVVVPEEQLSLAIGREGQNVRLAARVSGWKIDIKSKSQLEDSDFDFESFLDVDENEEDVDENKEGPEQDVEE
ncbi:MAG: transcription termination/antitermination protein NusA [Clostridiales bacterium]|nr:transcription termination/antitermination protein NusA [Clostridiales bacterium]